MPFRDRRDAGQKLARALAPYAREHPVVLALPRGGVPVGYEVAHALRAPLDVVVVRKIGAPGQPEFGVGAIAPGGVAYFDRWAIQRLGVPERDLAATVQNERQELDRRHKLFRGDRPFPELRGRTVMLVDDGLATGGTAQAAIAFLRGLEPRRLVLAVPVGAPETVAKLQPLVDDLICLETPPYFGAVGAWYRNFAQTSDQEVIGLLEANRREVA